MYNPHHPYDLYFVFSVDSTSKIFTQDGFRRATAKKRQILMCINTILCNLTR